MEIPIAYFEATWNGQTYRWGLELVRGPGSAINAEDDGEQRDRIVRFLSSPVSPNDPPLTVTPASVGAGSAVGFTKGFHIPRAFAVAAAKVAEAQGGLLALLLTDESLRTIDAKAFGKGYAKLNGKKKLGGNATGGVLPVAGPGTYESHSTASNSIHYTGRTMAVEQGYVVVVTGRAPTTPTTLGGDATMGAGTDMRYWSFTHYCTGPVLDDATTILRTSPFSGLNCGSLQDEQVTTVSRGDEEWYAIVLSQPEDRPSLATRGRGFTWQDWGPTPVQPTGFRWMAIGERPGVDQPGEAWANYGTLGDTVANSSVIVPDIENLPFVTSFGEGSCGNDWRELCAKSADPLAPRGYQDLDTSWSARTRTDENDAFTFIGKNERTESVMKDYHPEYHYLTKEQFDALSSAERRPWDFGGGQYKTGW